MENIGLTLAQEDIVRLKNSSKVAQYMEDYWARRIEGKIKSFIPEIIQSLETSDTLPYIDLVDIFCQHYFQVSIESMKYAKEESLTITRTPLPKRTGLAKYPPVRTPNSLEKLMKLYDLYRKGKFVPKRPAAEAKKVQKKYLEKVKSVWEKHSVDWRSGDTGTQELIVKKIEKEANTTTARAKNIVRTETTNYYNSARKEFYDQSQDITHYLFIAVRDAGTSPWCTPLTINGYRGRSGLVYAKSDPLCDKERPACHPGCRSEYLPLSNLNPAHLRFIQNLKIQRRENTCFPLLKNWRAA